jgi:tetratricopeptide (TPR) repeat protein
MSQPLLSLCMIVKNEAYNLPRCLASAQPHVNEMIVVDTGSEDNTVEVARQFGAKISYFEWCDDFAAARNAALAEATGEWILVLDADEELIVKIENLHQQLQRSADVREYACALSNIGSDKNLVTTFVARLFRNLPGVYFLGRFHEQVCFPENSSHPKLSQTLEGIEILHYGYTPEIKTQKLINRNIPILESMRQQEELGLMWLTSLADMYEVAGFLEQSQACYSEAFERILPYVLQGDCPSETGYLRFLLYKLGWQSLDTEDYETARLLMERGLTWFFDYPPLSYVAGLTLFHLGFPRGAIAYFEDCLQMQHEKSYTKAEPFDSAYMSSHPAFSMGYSWMRLNCLQKAEAAFKLCLSYDPNYEPASIKLAEIADICD